FTKETKASDGNSGDVRLTLMGQSPAGNVRRFTKANAQAFAHAAQICASKGHSLGGRMPDMHSFACGNSEEIGKYACHAIAGRASIFANS
ncbi:hypothetical protein, partial [Candidatus Magnetaquicoccus inordinatus]|uniref:hypothetical protein n=1 Tax=Candidatus Magnetaquicoccus inordinatus TaxID=2496818 RepID=UPI001D0F07CB